MKMNGRELRRWRRMNDLTQQQIANQMGCTVMMISYIEREKRFGSYVDRYNQIVQNFDN